MSLNKNRIIEIKDVNPHVIKMENPVVGPVVARAKEIHQELEMGIKKPFKEVIRTNIGDGHAMGQTPITFVRQVFALLSVPQLFDDPSFPEDVKKRADELLNALGGRSIGSYTEGAGISFIRRHVAEYITSRDGGFVSNWEDIILCTGATIGIKSSLNLIASKESSLKSGALIPIPQYPVYSALLAEMGNEEVDYYLDESKNWEVNIKEIEQTIFDARKRCNLKVLVVINPGNPTGQVLSKNNMEEIIKLAYREKLLIFADEVYQENIYDDKSTFHSFKKVIMEMGYPYSEMELISFMSASKGYLGECGARGGYMEVVNFCPEVKKMLIKSISAMLCTNVLGQVAVDCVANPPKKGDASYELFMKEKTDILESFKFRSKLIVDEFNAIDGITCNPVQGALYAFPNITIPTKAIKAAEEAGQLPDEFYCFQLLEYTGICVVPGSGFGQREGSYHFRTTILPPVELLKTMVKELGKFHKEFTKKYS